MKNNRQATNKYALKVTKHGPTIEMHDGICSYDTIEQAAQALKEITEDFGKGYWIWKVDGQDVRELSETEQAIAEAAFFAGADMRRSRAKADFISSLNRVLLAAGAKPLDEWQAEALGKSYPLLPR